MRSCGEYFFFFMDIDLLFFGFKFICQDNICHLVTIRKGTALKKAVDKNSDNIMMAFTNSTPPTITQKNTPTTTSRNTTPTNARRVPGAHVFNKMP